MEEAVTALAHHLPDSVIGHELTAAHVVERCFHGGGLIAVGALAGGSKYVSGGEMAGAQTLGEEFGLRAFAYARRS